MDPNNLTDIEKKFIDQQVAEWKKQVYAERAQGLDVDTLNTRLAVKHDDGEVWEILIKCKRIAAPVKTGPVGLTTWDKKNEVHYKGEEVLDLSGQIPDPNGLPPTSRFSTEKIVEGLQLLPGGKLHVNEQAAAGLNGVPHSFLGQYDSRLGHIAPGSLEMDIMGHKIPLESIGIIRPGGLMEGMLHGHPERQPMWDAVQRGEEEHRRSLYGDFSDGPTPEVIRTLREAIGADRTEFHSHEYYLKKGLQKCPITDEDIMNTKAGMESAAPFFELMDKSTKPSQHPCHFAGYGEL